MIQLLSVILLSFSVVANAYEWIESSSSRDDSHPLWKALSLVEVTEAGRNLEKNVGRIVCRQTSGPGLRGGKLYTTNCIFPDDLSHQEILNLFKLLDVPEKHTSAIYTSIKVVGRLFIVGDEESDMRVNASRLFLEHPCREVGNEKQAKSCMDFWADKVLPSHNSDNCADLTSCSEQNKTRLHKIMDWNHLNDNYKAAAEQIMESADYIGIMLEFQDEAHLHHYALKNGRDVVPRLIVDTNEANLAYGPLRSELANVPPEKLDAFIAMAKETFFLGLPEDLFEDFSAYAIDSGLRELHQEVCEERLKK